MFATGHPYTGRDLADALASLEREGSDYLATLTDSVFFAPQGSWWSPAEHIRHLRKAAAPVTVALRVPAWILRLRFGRPHGPSRPFPAVQAAYRAALTAGDQAGRYAPSKEPPPAEPAVRRAEIMAAWKDADAALARALRRWPDSALDGTCLPHPLMGRLTAREMIAFTVYHTAHHLTRVAERAAVAPDITFEAQY